MTPRQLRYFASARFACYQSLQHSLARQSKDVAENVPNLHVGVFQNLLHPVPLVSRSADNLFAAARQVP